MLGNHTDDSASALDIPGNISGAEGGPVTFVGIVTSPGASSNKKGKRWMQDPGRTLKVVELLIAGNPPSVVAKKLGISNRLEHHHRTKAEKLGVIKRKGRSRPLIYVPGPHYNHRKVIISRGGSGRRIVIPSCRLHPPQGNSFSFPVFKEGEQHSLRTNEGNSLPLFNKKGGRDASLPIPDAIIGRPGGLVKVSARGASLMLSAAPEMRIPAPSVLEGLLALGNGPYGFLLDWVVDLFTSNGWRLGPPSLPSHYHFAFDLEAVSSICSELLEGVPVLGRGQEESDLVLWCDSSHGCLELETSVIGTALDIFSLLTVAQQSGIHSRSSRVDARTNAEVQP